MTKGNKCLRKYAPSLLLFLLFEAVAVTLWLTKDNLFYLLNFSYIGGCLAAGTVLFTAGKRYARHFVQLAVGSYMLLYLGVISRNFPNTFDYFTSSSSRPQFFFLSAVLYGDFLVFLTLPPAIVEGERHAGKEILHAQSSFLAKSFSQWPAPSAHRPPLWGYAEIAA